MPDHAKAMAASLEDDLAVPVRAHNVERALEAVGLDFDFDRAHELVSWADSYGEPEEWCKKAQSLHGQNEKLLAALGSFVEWFETCYPAGQSKQLPGLTLYTIAEGARAALKARGV